MERAGEKFLVNKFDDLHKSREVESGIREIKTYGATPDEHKREERVKTYLDRIDYFISDDRKLKKLKAKVLRQFAIDIENPDLVREVSEQIFKSQIQALRDRGQSYEADHAERNREQLTPQLASEVQEKFEAQQRTLYKWLEYMSHNDGNYPMWFRYFVIRSLRTMGTFDRSEMKYNYRTETTVAPFPELNPEALGFVWSSIEAYTQLDKVDLTADEEQAILSLELSEEELEQIKQKTPSEHVEKAVEGRLKNKRRSARANILEEKRSQIVTDFVSSIPLATDNADTEDALEKRVRSADFADLYAFAQIETTGSIEKITTNGEWKKYNQGSDYKILEQDLAGKGTGWCTATGSAKTQLEQGDFYVYYTLNSEGEATEPRIAIRMEQGKVEEVRGIEGGGSVQAIESGFEDIAKVKFLNLPGGERYENASEDMKRVTELYARLNTNEESYTDEDIIFILELRRKIESFGYERDQRIEDIESSHQFQRSVNVHQDSIIQILHGENNLRGLDQFNFERRINDDLDFIDEMNINADNKSSESSNLSLPEVERLVDMIDHYYATVEKSGDHFHRDKLVRSAEQLLKGRGVTTILENKDRLKKLTTITREQYMDEYGDLYDYREYSWFEYLYDGIYFNHNARSLVEKPVDTFSEQEIKFIYTDHETYRRDIEERLIDKIIELRSNEVVFKRYIVIFNDSPDVEELVMILEQERWVRSDIIGFRNIIDRDLTALTIKHLHNFTPKLQVSVVKKIISLIDVNDELLFYLIERVEQLEGIETIEIVNLAIKDNKLDFDLLFNNQTYGHIDTTDLDYDDDYFDEH